MLLTRTSGFVRGLSPLAMALLAPNLAFGQPITLSSARNEINVGRFGRPGQTSVLDAVALPQGRSALLLQSPMGVRVVIVSPQGDQIATSPDLPSTIGLRLPKAIAANETGRVYVLDQQGAVAWFDATRDNELQLSGSRHLTLAAASDICALRGRVFVLGV